MSSECKIAAILKAKTGKAAELETLLRGMVGPSRAEPGTLRYDLWRDPYDPTAYFVDELYRDDASLSAHRETPHFRRCEAQINDLATRTAFFGDPVDVELTAPSRASRVQPAPVSEPGLQDEPAEFDALDEALQETFPASDPISPMRR